MSTLEDVETWRGKKMVDADGDKIGTIEAVFLDRQTGQPAWAAVKTACSAISTRSSRSATRR
jgi:PRC-barrel domain